MAGAPMYAHHRVEVKIHSSASIIFAGKTSIVLHWRNSIIKTASYWITDKTFKFMAERLETVPMVSSLGYQKFQEKLGSHTKNNKEEAKKMLEIKHS
ncbi:hypothetical protein [Bartonella sp. CB169]|uniref:hypothetical protein n=1 Tax=Bartonella sp. CB169 TaxID=3112257 RepID=UPI00300E038B